LGRRHAHGVDELTADELRTGDERLRGRDVLLQQHEPVRTGFHPPVAHRRVEGLDGLEELHAEALAALVVLRHERRGHGACGVEQVARADDRDRTGDIDAGGTERGVLVDLAHLQLEHAPAVDDTAAVPLEPREHGAGLLLGERVPAGVARGRHPRPEHPGRRLGVQVEPAGPGEQPLLDGNVLRLERRGERRPPVGVLVDREDRRGLRVAAPAAHRARHLSPTAAGELSPVARGAGTTGRSPRSRQASTTRTAATTSTEAPSMCRPTRTTGRSVKYCT
jgi:hypothetical protein